MEWQCPCPYLSFDSYFFTWTSGEASAVATWKSVSLVIKLSLAMRNNRRRSEAVLQVLEGPIHKFWIYGQWPVCIQVNYVGCLLFLGVVQV